MRRLLRFEAYSVLFMFAGLFGAFLTGMSLSLVIGILLVFIATSSEFGFVINDISDATLDAMSEKPRNPLADGSMSRGAAWVVSIFLLALALASMALMPPALIPVGLLVLLVFVTYSFGPEVKNIAGLDLVYHASFPALYGLIGYALIRPGYAWLLPFVPFGIFLVHGTAWLISTWISAAFTRQFIRAGSIL